jgi:PAS domain S-box-containing protein
VTAEARQRDVAERALAASENRLRQLIDAVPAAFFLTNNQGECVLVNQHWFELTGLDEERSMGLGWLGAIHPDDRLQLAAGLGAPERVGQPFEGRYRLQRSDGAVVWVRTNAVPLLEADGTVTGYAGFSIDITASVDAASALRRANDELAATLSALKTLRGLIPICATCKRIRDDDGAWNRLEEYISAHTDAEFSHGICPDCLERALSDSGS